jgi:hypothetical protein
MLRATDFKRRHLSENDVKSLLIDACIECECERMAIVYAVEDVDKVISRRNWGDVVLWALTKDMTFMFFNRILDEDDIELLQDTNELLTIRKMYRIERMTSDFDIVELKFNE